MLGFTWCSLTSQTEEDTEMTGKDDQVFAYGSYVPSRESRPFAAGLRALVRVFGQTSIVPHAGLFEVAGRPARLKAEA